MLSLTGVDVVIYSYFGRGVGAEEMISRTMGGGIYYLVSGRAHVSKHVYYNDVILFLMLGRYLWLGFFKPLKREQYILQLGKRGTFIFLKI